MEKEEMSVNGIADKYAKEHSLGTVERGDHLRSLLQAAFLAGYIHAITSERGCCDQG